MHFWEIICEDIAFKSVAIRDVASGVWQVRMHLRGPAGHLGPLTHLCWVTVANFRGMRIRPPPGSWALSKCQGAQQDHIPSWGALEGAGSYVRSNWGCFWRPLSPRGTEGRGPVAWCTRLQKSYLRLFSPLTSAHMINSVKEQYATTKAHSNC